MVRRGTRSPATRPPPESSLNRLPALPADAETDRADARHPAESQSSSASPPGGRSTNPQRSGTMNPLRPGSVRSRPVVLLVDGNEDTREMYALALSGMDFEIVTARDDVEGLSRASTTHPDVIVMDLPTPTGDGWAFVRDLRQSPRTSEIPLIAVSGHVQRSVRLEAERAGFAAFFGKPCLPDELATGLRRVLGGKMSVIARP
jgi:two-component system cell cycle response regulator DivK